MAYVATVMGLGVYMIQSWFYAHTIPSVLDEGSYLYKGYLFATGQYVPFQDYGPWTNHMPLSFLIPGYIQKWFGPGLGVVRVFMIALGILTLLGIWIIVRRFSGAWWAAAAIWLMALSPAAISVYSLASSQGLVACMLVWVLVLTLGDARPFWQLMLGGALAGILWLTRINLAPVLLLLILYILWQYDLKTAFVVAFIGFTVLALGHVPYWPEILRFWSKWLPRSLTPFLDTWRLPAVDNAPGWRPEIETLDRVLSFLRAIKAHIIAFTGWLAFLLIWPFPKQWKLKAHYKTAVFLFTLFGLLFLVHAWASLGNSYCVDCLTNYTSFFSFVGVILFCVGYPNTTKKEIRWMRWVSVPAIVILSSGAAFAFTLDEEIKLWLLDIPIPRIQSLRFLPGTTPFGVALDNKFGFSDKLLKHLLNIPAGLLVGLFLALIGIYLYKKTNIGNFSKAAVSTLFIASTLISSASLIGYTDTSTNCGDVISANESVGYYLSEVIPAGSKVYWDGGSSIVPMLYAPDVNLYLPQINGDYSFRLGSDADNLLKFGLWNAGLAQQWKEDADYILIDERHYNDDWSYFLVGGSFDEIGETVATNPCRKDSRIHIFRRIP